MNRPARPGELRSRDTIRHGAEEGVTQVLAPAEILRILDRIEELEQIERAVEAFVDLTRLTEQSGSAAVNLIHALAGRTTTKEN